jgi:hypothetical protein
MKTTCLSKAPLHLPTGWLPILYLLLLLALLLPARAADDPYFPNPNFPRDATVSLGATVSFQVSASTTNPPLTTQWQHEGTNLDGATLSALRLTNVTELDAGGYQAIIWNASGNSATSRVAQLTVDRTFIKITTGPVVTDAEASIGASWFDYDNDGDVDLFVAVMSGRPCSLYQNNGDGTFTKVTNTLTSSLIADAITAPIADFDNDGLLDLFLVRQNAGSQNLLFRNTGNGSWAKLPANTFDSPCTGSSDAAWVDYDRDGFVDLFTQNGYGSQVNDALYRNLGNGTFHKMPCAEVGLGCDNAWAVGCAWSDYDNDGWPDVFLAQANSTADTSGVFHNDGHGRFSRVNGSAIELLPGYPGAPSWIDYDSDGLPDLFHFSWPEDTGGQQSSALYRNLGNGTFTNVPNTGINPSQDPIGGEVSAWGDYDNDGFIDLLTLPWARSTGPGFLYRNLGNGTFQPVPAGSPLVDGGTIQNVTWADYNNDGFLDLYLSCMSASFGPERNNLYQNNGPRAGNTNHWLKVKLEGRASNRAAIGAKVRVQATIAGTPRTQLREISGNYGYLAREVPSLIAHFGLRDATNIDLVRIEWPSGNVQELTNVTPNQLLRVPEPPYINPARPSASLNGSVTLTRTAVSGATYQWQFEGVDLDGQTGRTLALSNITTNDAGRYSVVVSTATSVVTNFVYLIVDATFTKITTGPVVESNAEPFGAAWGDYDNDDYIDLFLANGAYGSKEFNCLYHNNKDGTFAKTTTNEVGSIVGDRGAWGSVAWGDYDNDGFLELTMSSAELSSPWLAALYRNRGDGKFDRVTDAGAVVTNRNCWGSPCWGDYDNDGFLDLLMPNSWLSAPYGPVRNLLGHNNGDGTFSQADAGSLVTDLYDLQGAGWCDLDSDGDLDLVVATATLNIGSEAYRNDGGGHFVRVTQGSLPQDTGLAITPSFGDYDNDGRLDAFIPMYNDPSHLFHNEGNWQFTKSLFGPAGAETGMGVWGDYDNDGFLDLFIARGQNATVANLLYRNNGDGTFTQVGIGSLVNDLGRSPTCAWGDYDNDGFLDLYVPRRPPESCLLYHNNGNGNHWLLVKLVGTTSNRSAIGAKVRTYARISGKWTWQMREVAGGNRAQNDLRPHFGLGDATNITTLRIEWPSGTVQELTNVAADQILEVIEPRRPVLAFLDLSPSKVDGSLQADAGISYVVEFSEDLASWTELATVTTDASGVAAWSDTSSPLATHRYYKASRSVP